MIRILESIDYKVYFDDSLQSLADFISEKKYSQIIVLVDSHTQELCLPILQTVFGEKIHYDIIEIDPGEENKTIDYCIGVWQTMLDFEIDRNALLINLGGGVVTDLGGFVASTYKRGIDFVQVPTTLLSQVDASVGGKTGIDMHNLKNVVGTFTQPKGVFISTHFLNTLDSKQKLSGFAEIIKHGLIADASIYKDCKTIRIDQIDQDLIYRSVIVKNDIIKKDPKEQNIRKILNFGHTIGHAIEANSLERDARPLLHGEAIAIGMICESYLSYRLNALSKEDLEDITNFFISKYPAYHLEKQNDDRLLELMKNDKKNQQNKIGFSLLKSIGACEYNIYVDEEDIIGALDYYREIKL